MTTTPARRTCSSTTTVNSHPAASSVASRVQLSLPSDSMEALDGKETEGEKRREHRQRGVAFDDTTMGDNENLGKKSSKCASFNCSN